MIHLVIFLYVLAGVTATRSELPKLVAASRVSRGYLPETIKARWRAISTTADSLTHHSADLKKAVTVRLKASYRFMYMLRRVIVIYARLSSLYFLPGQKPATLTERLNSALDGLRECTHDIIQSIKNAFSILPGWAPSIESQYEDLARAVIVHIGNLNAVMTNLVRKQTLKTIFAARAQLLEPFLDPMIAVVEQFEMEVMSNDAQALSPLDLLNALSTRVNADTRGVSFWDWTLRYATDLAMAEVYLLTAKRMKRTDLIKSLCSGLFSILLLTEYASRIPRYPSFDWEDDTYPGDMMIIDGSHESASKAAAAKDTYNRTLERWIRFVSSLFRKSLQLDKQDRRTISIIGKALVNAGQQRADAEEEIWITRKRFITEGLKYLK